MDSGTDVGCGYASKYRVIEFSFQEYVDTQEYLNSLMHYCYFLAKLCLLDFLDLSMHIKSSVRCSQAI